MDGIPSINGFSEERRFLCLRRRYSPSASAAAAIKAAAIATPAIAPELSGVDDSEGEDDDSLVAVAVDKELLSVEDAVERHDVDELAVLITTNFPVFALWLALSTIAP